MKKGSKVYLEGQLETRKYQDKAGQERYTTEVVLRQFRGELALLDSKGSGSGQGANENDDMSYMAATGAGGHSAGGIAGPSALRPAASATSTTIFRFERRPFHKKLVFVRPSLSGRARPFPCTSSTGSRVPASAVAGCVMRPGLPFAPFNQAPAARTGSDRGPPAGRIAR